MEQTSICISEKLKKKKDRNLDLEGLTRILVLTSAHHSLLSTTSLHESGFGGNHRQSSRWNIWRPGNSSGSEVSLLCDCGQKLLGVLSFSFCILNDICFLLMSLEFCAS